MTNPTPEEEAAFEAWDDIRLRDAYLDGFADGKAARPRTPPFKQTAKKEAWLLGYDTARKP